MNTTALIDRQIATAFTPLPDEDQLTRWVGLVLDTVGIEDERELTLRFVDDDEMRDLNATYRGKDKSTNVLSFPFEAPAGIELPLLGDLVLSPHVIDREAREQGKTLQDHFTHMVIHGTLHLLGYDHIEDAEAEEMEAMERRLLSELGISDPYLPSKEDERPPE
ncbi:rRNA maturation RNase YbeY [Larsenimonas rhizosphaerae]|uniref:Endoribonuclease YbeY n=1 Tax=Larsenimonas rhizosphaerae TaxID=2944682 RepID=A0AA41ZEK7_9GAMM|nr:rRNA maturation RNase YbeY [Larsenimonas rhizosphaerae]MCX2523862.1 rRNA maturation RNase YbeY [Larsenimonas rhizosphaerae]